MPSEGIWHVRVIAICILTIRIKYSMVQHHCKDRLYATWQVSRRSEALWLSASGIMRSVTGSRQSTAVFRKGRSGNPGGRPRGKSLATLLRAALAETATIEVKGRRRRVSKGQAMVALLIDRAAEDDPRWMKLLLDL